MNLYFLVEGEQTEMNIYPRYLSYILPEITRVNLYHHANKNNYYLMSGRGIPSIYNHLVNAIADVNSSKLYNYLILCLDTEEYTLAERKAEVFNHLQKRNVSLHNLCQLIIVFQNPCIETWFLGNTINYIDNPITLEFIECSKYYNVAKNDPESMGKKDFNTKAQYHEYYLKKMLSEKNKHVVKDISKPRIRYSKEYTDYVAQKEYFVGLLNRISTTDHCVSFKYFYDFCLEIKNKISL